MSVNLVPDEILFTTEEENTLQAVSYIGVASLVVITVVAVTFLIAGQFLAYQKRSLTSEISSIETQLDQSQAKEILYRAVKSKATKLEQLTSMRYPVVDLLGDIYESTAYSLVNINSLSYGEQTDIMLSLSAPQLTNFNVFLASTESARVRYKFSKMSQFDRKPGSDYKVSFSLKPL